MFDERKSVILKYHGIQQPLFPSLKACGFTRTVVWIQRRNLFSFERDQFLPSQSWEYCEVRNPGPKSCRENLTGAKKHLLHVNAPQDPLDRSTPVLHLDLHQDGPLSAVALWHLSWWSSYVSHCIQPLNPQVRCQLRLHSRTRYVPLFSSTAFWFSQSDQFWGAKRWEPRSLS